MGASRIEARRIFPRDYTAGPARPSHLQLSATTAVQPSASSPYAATAAFTALQRQVASSAQHCPHRRCCCTCGGDGTDVMSGMSRVVSYALCSGAGLAARRALMVWCGRHRSQETRRRRRIRTSTAQQWSPYGGSSALGH